MKISAALQGASLRFRFSKKHIEALYTEEQGAHKYDSGVVEAFFEVMAIIEAAKDERDLYAMKSLRFEKLKGKRKGERSIRLTRQWRLIVTIEKDDNGSIVVIIDIEDYH